MSKDNGCNQIGKRHCEQHDHDFDEQCLFCLLEENET